MANTHAVVLADNLGACAHACVVDAHAGRGPLAGPVVAAICVLPRNAPESLLQGLNDSKLLDEGQREALYARITSMPGVLWAA